MDNTADRVSEVILSKIYLNLGIIATQQENFESALYHHEKSLEFKRAYLSENTEEEERRQNTEELVTTHTTQIRGQKYVKYVKPNI